VRTLITTTNADAWRQATACGRRRGTSISGRGGGDLIMKSTSVPHERWLATACGRH